MRATLRYGDFKMEVSISQRTPPPVLYIPKPPSTFRSSWINSWSPPSVSGSLPVLEFIRAKKLDEYGFHWEYHFSKEI